MVTIYALTCLANGKAYIGCTRGKIAKRFREHRCLLNASKHSEPLLQADWLQYGQQMFAMETVMQLEEDVSLHALRAMETFTMQRYKATGMLYNQNEASFMPTRAAIMKSASMGVNRGRMISEEQKLKQRMSQLGIPKNHGAKISATKKALGQRPTKEAARLGGIAACKKRYQAMR